MYIVMCEALQHVGNGVFAHVCVLTQQHCCLAQSLQKAQAPNESRQVSGRAAVTPFLTTDRFKMNPSQKCAAVFEC